MKIRKNEFGNIQPKDARKVDELMHQYMTGLIEDIATSISEFGNSKGHNLPFSYYKKLASLSLEENIKYNMMILDNILDQDEEQELTDIHKTLLDEFKNRPNAKGTKCSN